MTTTWTATAESIRALRTLYGETQEEFAHRVGVSVAQFNRWENGHFKPMRVYRRILDRLAADAPSPTRT